MTLFGAKINDQIAASPALMMVIIHTIPNSVKAINLLIITDGYILMELHKETKNTMNNHVWNRVYRTTYIQVDCCPKKFVLFTNFI